MVEMRPQIAVLLERISRLLIVDRHAEGLKPVQWEALRYLACANRFSRTPGALTAYLGATKGTVSQTLMALERNGYIRKRPVMNDKRLVYLELLPSGHQRIRHDPADRMETVIADMSEREQIQLSNGLGILLRSRLSADGRKMFGKCNTCRHFRPDHPHGAPHQCALLDENLTESDSTLICVEHE